MELPTIVHVTSSASKSYGLPVPFLHASKAALTVALLRASTSSLQGAITISVVIHKREEERTQLRCLRVGHVHNRGQPSLKSVDSDREAHLAVSRLTKAFFCPIRSRASV